MVPDADLIAMCIELDEASPDLAATSRWLTKWCGPHCGIVDRPPASHCSRCHAGEQLAAAGPGHEVSAPRRAVRA